MPTNKKFNARDLIGKTQERTLSVDRGAIDEESRTVDLAFSSTEPYERWWGIEILDHADGSMDMDRLNNSAAVLVNHDRDHHVAVVESARIDDETTGRAVVRFGRGAEAEEVFQDVKDGIRTKVSVGYMVNAMHLEKSEDGVDTYRIDDFTPYEISLVAVPADDTVGVGRSATYHQPKQRNKAMDPILDAHEEAQTDTTPQAADTARGEETTHTTEAPIQTTSKDAAAMIKLARKFDKLDLAETYISDGRSLQEFNRALLESMDNTERHVPTERRDPRVDIQIPRRRGTLKAFSNDRAGEEAAYRSGMWALAAIHGNRDAARWCKDYDVRVMTGQTSGTSSVVPEEMVLPIIDLREQYGIARRLCYVHPMTSDTATVPRRKSGVTAYFPGRTEATTASDAAFDDIELVAREVSALTRLSKAYAMDSAINLGDHLAGEMAYAFAVKEDDCLIKGDGTSTYGGIYGINSKIIDGNHTAGAKDAASGIDTLAEITADDLTTASGALPDFPGINPVWLTSKLGNALVFDALKAAGGGNTITDLGGAPAKQWLGDPIETSQSMPKVTTDLSNVVMLVYGDLNMGTTFGDRQGFEVDVLTERYAEYRQIGVIATERMDIVVHGLGDTSAAGPIVALIGE